MDKFLKVVESNIPEKDIDKLMQGKRELVSLFLSKNISAVPRVFRDIIEIKHNNKKYILEVKDVVDVQDTPAEDAEDDVFQLTAQIARGGGKNSPQAMRVMKELETVEQPIIGQAEKRIQKLKRKAYEDSIDI